MIELLKKTLLSEDFLGWFADHLHWDMLPCTVYGIDSRTTQLKFVSLLNHYASQSIAFPGQSTALLGSLTSHSIYCDVTIVKRIKN